MAYNPQLRAAPNQSSPVFIWTNSSDTISAGSSLTVSWEVYKPSANFYLPFNYTRITNKSLADITFYPNQDSDQGIPIPAGSNVSIDADVVPAVWSFRIKNEDSTQTISTSQIIILGSRVALRG